jgi:hypothetical protein
MKKLFITSIIVMVLSMIPGVYCKKSFIRQDDLSQYKVALLDGEYAETMSDEYIKKIEKSEYILKVRCISDVTFSYLRTYQEVEVEKVFQGKNISEGDNIFISVADSYIFFSDMSINMGFVNAMNKDEEYLVFIAEKQKSKELSFSIYTPCETLLSPVFSYSEHDNVIPEEYDPNIPYVSYTSVMGNEFFVGSEEGLKNIINIKESLISKYK